MENIKLAYCPTMEPFAGSIDEAVTSVELIPAPSAAMVLQMLTSGAVDSVLIGRVAKSRELTGDIGFRRLRDGITLVYRQKAAVPEEQLREIPVKTYLPESSLRGITELFASVDFLPALDECVKDGLTLPVLIDWRDFRDSFELLIPVNENGKVPLFRAPVIYYRTEVPPEVVERIAAAVGKG